MPTRLAIEQDIIRALAPGDESVALVSVPSVTTALGTTTTLLDSALGRGSTNVDLYSGRFIKITELVAGGPAVGEIAVATDGGFSSPATLTFAPALTDEVQSGTDYFLYPRGTSPAIVTERINQVLRETFAPGLWFPSLAADADFEDNSVTPWPAVGAGTRSFVTTSSFFGERSLNVVGTSDGDGARSSSINVSPGEQLLITVFAAVTTGSLEVALTNTSGTLITGTTAVVLDETAIMEIRFPATVPADTLAVQLRFTQDGATALDANVMAPVVVQSVSGRGVYDIPTWLTNPDQLLAAYRLPQGFPGDETYLRVPLSRRPRIVASPHVLYAARDLTAHHLSFRVESEPVFFDVRRPFAEVTTDTGETTADRRYVAAAALATLFRDRQDRQWALWRRRSRGLARQLGYGGPLLLVDNPLTVV